VIDGRIVAAAQEERFSRKRHDPDFPADAVAYCLSEGGLSARQLDYVVFYEKPFQKLDRLLETYLAYAPRGWRSFSLAMPQWLGKKLNLRHTLRRALGDEFAGQIVFTGHHESHAASAFFPSPYEEAAILTLDGVGEWSTAACGRGEANRIALTSELRFPHSLGLLYSAFTYYCGFKVNSGEYKLMGLAPYGKPIYRDAIYEHLIDVQPDGSFWLNMRYFNYCRGLTMTGERFHRLFGGPPRRPETDLTQRHMDLAASIQSVTEDIMLRMAGDLHKATRASRLVLAGGVALNCVANGRLLREGPFESIWIQPAASDAGGALGAALFVWHQLLGRPRQADTGDSQRGSLLGPSFSGDQIERFLQAAESPFQKFSDEARLLAHVAELLASGNVVGWFQGRMEFGPRALGARSILADPRAADTQARLNLKIKFRESFRPFAPCVLREAASEWFDIPLGTESPYMLLTAPVCADKRCAIPTAELRTMQEHADLRKRVNVVRSQIPAVTHVDYSARLQTVDRDRNPRFWRLLEAFRRQTGCPVLVNTSFNVRGEPIVCTPAEAYQCFLATDMDVLVMEDFVLTKAEGRQAFNEAQRLDHLAQFQLD
jgi:carbamoyltransferase